jgi:hypothetical protein
MTWDACGYLLSFVSFGRDGFSFSKALFTCWPPARATSSANVPTMPWTGHLITSLGLGFAGPTRPVPHLGQMNILVLIVSYRVGPLADRQPDPRPVFTASANSSWWPAIDFGLSKPPFFLLAGSPSGPSSLSARAMRQGEPHGLYGSPAARDRDAQNAKT